MIKFSIWGASTLLLLLTIVDKIAKHEGPSWWTVLLAFAAGLGVLQIAHVWWEERKAEADHGNPT